MASYISFWICFCKFPPQKMEAPKVSPKLYGSFWVLGAPDDNTHTLPLKKEFDEGLLAPEIGCETKIGISNFIEVLLQCFDHLRNLRWKWVFPKIPSRSKKIKTLETGIVKTTKKSEREKPSHRGHHVTKVRFSNESQPFFFSTRKTRKNKRFLTEISGF